MRGRATRATRVTGSSAAIYLVPASSPTASFSWAPSLPSAGDYAVYGIYHAGGLAEVAQDQRAGAGQWRYLGTWAFDPAGSPLVVLAGGSDGALSADAIRFVGAGPAPADLRFVHNDHLGTPQKLTDNTGTLVWDRTQTPFGLDHSVSGAATTPVRFPGQYADGESALHYNYFRDYDPSLGRYVQSDPIGFDGGLNTFSYVLNAPLSYSDPFGLDINLCFYSDAAMGFGHVGFGLPGESSTQGFYPTGNPFSSPGTVKPDEQKESQCKTVESLPEQDECMSKCRENRKSNPGRYTLLGRQCTSFTRDFLSKCGIPTGDYSGPRPRPFFQSVPGKAHSTSDRK